MPSVNENAAKPTPAKLPERCTKAAFARLLDVDAALVSRWIAGRRVETDDAGRVLVRQSLTKLLLTTDPVRGGRGAVRGAGSGGTIDRARELLERDGDTPPANAAPGSSAARLADQLADALAQLEIERKFREEWHYHHHVEAQLRCRLVDTMREQWPALTAALATGGDAFDRLMFRIECRIYNSMTDEEIAAEEGPMFDEKAG